MHRSPPPPDWEVYLIIFGIVISMMLGKYILFKDDKKNKDD